MARLVELVGLGGVAGGAELVGLARRGGGLAAPLVGGLAAASLRSSSSSRRLPIVWATASSASRMLFVKSRTIWSSIFSGILGAVEHRVDVRPQQLAHAPEDRGLRHGASPPSSCGSGHRRRIRSIGSRRSAGRSGPSRRRSSYSGDHHRPPPDDRPPPRRRRRTTATAAAPAAAQPPPPPLPPLGKPPGKPPPRPPPESIPPMIPPMIAAATSPPPPPPPLPGPPRHGSSEAAVVALGERERLVGQARGLLRLPDPGRRVGCADRRRPGRGVARPRRAGSAPSPPTPPRWVDT